jgi:hypothetical protein
VKLFFLFFVDLLHLFHLIHREAAFLLTFTYPIQMSNINELVVVSIVHL